jgi:hypothetical protein
VDYSWLDWRRVEACLRFDVTRWGLTIAALGLASYWISPVSEWLFVGAAVGILWVHDKLITRADAGRVDAIDPSVQSLAAIAKELTAIRKLAQAFSEETAGGVAGDVEALRRAVDSTNAYQMASDLTAIRAALELANARSERIMSAFSGTPPDVLQ